MKCPYCGLDGVQKNMRKVHIKEIYLPKNAIGVNKMITEILTECDYMIKNRFYMNDIAIKNCAERIKNIAKFYIQEVNRLDE